MGIPRGRAPVLVTCPVEAHDLRTGDIVRALGTLDASALVRELDALESMARAVLTRELADRLPWPER